MFKKVLSTVVSSALIWGNPCNQVSASLPKVFFAPISTNNNPSAAQNFLTKFKVLVRQPLHELISDFSNMYSFNHTDSNGNTRTMIFRNDAQVVGLANRIRSLIVERIQPLEEVIFQIVNNGNTPSRLPLDYLQRVNNAIEEIRKQMSNLTGHAPTFSDFLENRCIDAHLLD